MKTYKTEAAQVAALIKAELKAKFPTVVFSVKSQSYSGGDSVDVRYTATKTTPKLKTIEAICSKFKAGHFNGMEDIYEYTNKGTGPSAKYIFVTPDTASLRVEVLPELLASWGLTEEEFKNDSAVMKRCGQWPDTLLYQFLSTTYLN